MRNSNAASSPEVFSIILALAAGIGLLMSIAAPSEAGVLRALTDNKAGWFSRSSVDSTGTAAFVNASTDRFGGNPGHTWQVFRIDPVSGSGTQLTSFVGGVEDGEFQIDASDDGEWVTFISSANPLGQNPDRSPELFVMRGDGTQLAQLTDDPGPNGGAVSALALAGSGNRIAFVSTSDLAGSNLDHHQQLYVINRDGTGLRQLTAVTDEEIPYLDVSDDGQRIAFVHDGNLLGGNADGNYELHAVVADGTGLRQLTSSTTLTGVLFVAIAGNGGIIVWDGDADPTNGGAQVGGEVFAINWDGTGARRLTNTAPTGFATEPVITDDGQWVFFGALFPGGTHTDIWKVRSDGTMLANVSNGTDGHRRPSVSGNGSRLVCMSHRATPANADMSFELFGMDASGGGGVALTDCPEWETYNPDITPDGARVVFESGADLTGGNSDHSREVFRVQADGSSLVQVTSLNLTGELDPSVTTDGFTIVFSGGTAASSIPTIRRIHADGTGYAQLTSTALGFAIHPAVAAGGSIAVFDAQSASTNIYRVNVDGSGSPVQLTSGSLGTTSQKPRVDAAGTWLVFESNANLTGQNPDGSFEIYRLRSDLTVLKQVTADPLYASVTPDISASAARIVYVSSADPLGTNPDHNPEIFLNQPAGNVTTQLTFTDEGECAKPRISDDGSVVLFLATAPFVEEEHDEYRWDAYRVTVATGAVERLGGLRFGDASTFFLYYWGTPRPGAIDAGGQRIVFSGQGNLTGGNPDRFPEIWLADRTREPRIMPSGPAPTVVSWETEPSPRRYDVIRGDVAQLAGGAGAVDLGAVVCLENDSPDNDTLGFADTEDPPPGAAFFYAFRGSAGLDAGPGSYGQASNGGERTPSSGDCAP